MIKSVDAKMNDYNTWAAIIAFLSFRIYLCLTIARMIFPAKQGICTSILCVNHFRVRSLLLKNDLGLHAFSPSLLQWYICLRVFILVLKSVANHGWKVQSILLYANRWRKVWEEMKSYLFQCKANVNCPILYLNSVWWFYILSSPPHSFFF